MSNVCDYVKWRGDLELKDFEFNEIDNLILTRLAYFPFEMLINKGEEISITELSQRFKRADKTKIKVLWPEDNKLIPLLGNSERFGKIIATNFVNKINREQEKQFSAITLLLPDNTIFVSYRGTDDTLIGWKEDFNMSFKSHVASQLDAVEYLNNVASKYENKIRVGGHSKGGNLAVYASIFAKSDVKNRIINIYNNDGPGFDDEIIKMSNYKETIEKVHTYIPQSSVIGRLLNHEEKYTVVKSVQKGIMQHDLYSWQVEGKEFVCLKEVTNGSEIVDKTIKEWLKNIEPSKREEVINVVFDIINATDAKNFGEIKEKWFFDIGAMLKGYKNLDDENKKMIMDITKKLISAIRVTIKNDKKKIK